jgi:O-antigen/teichoic acid export membrane protein
MTGSHRLRGDTGGARAGDDEAHGTIPVAAGARAAGPLRRLLPSAQFSRRVALLAGGAAVGQGVMVLASPLLSRLYTPADFGVLAIFLSINYLLTLVAALRYDMAILLPEDDDTAGVVLALALLTVCATSGLFGAVLWLAGGEIVRRAGIPELGPYLWLVPVTLLGSGVYLVLTGWAVRAGRYRAIAGTQLRQGIIVVLLQTVLSGLGTAGLLLGAATGQASGTETLGIAAWRRHGHALRRLDVRRLLRVAARYRRFPLVGAPAALMNSVGLTLPTLVLGAFYNPQVVGWFALAQRVIARPVQLFAGSISQVYNGEIAKALTTDPRALPRILARVIVLMAAIALPYIAVLTLAGPRLFSFVFGTAWTEAGVYARLLAVGFVFQACISPVGDTLELLQRQDLYMIRECIRLAVLAAAVTLAAVLDLDAAGMVALVSVAVAVVYLVFLALVVYAVRVHVRTHAGRAHAGSG